MADQQELLDFIATNLDPSRVLVLTTDFHTNLAIRRPELTEVIVGPIGQTTFAETVRGILATLGLPPNLLPVFLGLFDGLVDLGNGGPGAVIGSAADAFSSRGCATRREATRTTSPGPTTRTTWWISSASRCPELRGQSRRQAATASAGSDQPTIGLGVLKQQIEPTSVGLSSVDVLQRGDGSP